MFIMKVYAQPRGGNRGTQTQTPKQGTPARATGLTPDVQRVLGNR